MFHLLVEITDFQLRQNLFSLLLIFPCFLMIHAYQQIFQSRMSLRFHAMLVFLDQFYHTVAMMEAGFQHSQFFGIFRILLQIVYTEIPTENNIPVIISLLPGKYIQKGRLSRPVFSDQSDTLPFGNTERYIFKQN